MAHADPRGGDKSKYRIIERLNVYIVGLKLAEVIIDIKVKLNIDRINPNPYPTNSITNPHPYLNHNPNSNVNPYLNPL